MDLVPLACEDEMLLEGDKSNQSMFIVLIRNSGNNASLGIFFFSSLLHENIFFWRLYSFQNTLSYSIHLRG